MAACRAGNGDGFNTNEFILNKGATLTSLANNPLVLGYQYTPTVGPVQNYPLPDHRQERSEHHAHQPGRPPDVAQRPPGDLDRQRGPERARRRQHHLQ